MNCTQRRLEWWRRRESNPRPEKLAAGRATCLVAFESVGPHIKTDENYAGPSPIDLGLRLRTEALRLSRKNDAPWTPARARASGAAA